MPRICLTEEQRQQAALDKTYQKIVDGLAAFQNRERMNNGQLAEYLGINRKSLTKLMQTDSLQIDVRVLLKVIRKAGMEVRSCDP